jgi:hypothetical protein
MSEAVGQYQCPTTSNHDSLSGSQRSMANPNSTRYKHGRTFRHLNIWKREHVMIAERALGKVLPPGTHIHHVDGDKGNNANRNLVICQDQAYHFLLHVRARVLRAGGNPNTQVICADCQRLCLISEMPLNRKRLNGVHNQCHPCIAARMLKRYYKRKCLTDHLCECGCGQYTYLALVGPTNGTPRKYRNGHRHRRRA